MNFIDLLTLIKYYIENIFSQTILKYIPIIIVFLFTELETALFLLFTLILIDTILGSFIALKRRKFTSRRFREGTIKILSYLLLIISVRLFEKTFLSMYDTIYLTTIVIAMIAFTELSSIVENLIKLKVPVPRDAFIRLTKKIIPSQIIVELIETHEHKIQINRKIDDLLHKHILVTDDYNVKHNLNNTFEIWIEKIVKPLLNEQCSTIDEVLIKLDINVKTALKQGIPQKDKIDKMIYKDIVRLFKYDEKTRIKKIKQIYKQQGVHDLNLHVADLYMNKFYEIYNCLMLARY